MKVTKNKAIGSSRLQEQEYFAFNKVESSRLDVQSVIYNNL